MSVRVYEVTRPARCAGWRGMAGRSCFFWRLHGSTALCPKCARFALELERRDREEERQRRALERGHPEPFSIAPSPDRYLLRRRAS